MEVDQRFEFGGFELEGVPFGPAAGAINGTNPDDIRAKLTSVLQSPAAFATLGSIGKDLRFGNSGQTYGHNRHTGVTLNSLGLPNVGEEVGLQILQEFAPRYRDAGKLLIASFSSYPGENAAEVLPSLAAHAVDVTDGQVVVEINLSCPNAFSEGGERKPILSYDIEALHQVRSLTRAAVGESIMLLEKLAPFIGAGEGMAKVTAGQYHRGTLPTTGATLFNTILGEHDVDQLGKPLLRYYPNGNEDLDPLETGGKSGPSVKEPYDSMQQDFIEGLDDDVEIVRAGGVFSGADVLDVTARRGAKLAGLVTRFWEGEKVGKTFGRIATEVAEEYAEAA